MKTCWFIVILSSDRWWVDCEGRSYGPFESRDDAVENAKLLVEAFGDPERAARIYAPDKKGRQRLAWQGPTPSA